MCLTLGASIAEVSLSAFLFRVIDHFSDIRAPPQIVSAFPTGERHRAVETETCV